MSARWPTISPSDLLRRAPSAGQGAVDLPIGVLDLFKIGIGPSSSHTIGPMKAAAAFVDRMPPTLLKDVTRISMTLFGSLAWTGLGHATDKALMLGLTGYQPDQVDPDDAERLITQIRSEQRIVLPSGYMIAFSPDRDIRFDKTKLFARHPNAMRFEAYDVTGQNLNTEIWFSIGGGFVELEGEDESGQSPPSVAGFTFHTTAELLELCRAHQCTIADIALANECARRSEPDTIEAIDRIVRVMMDCIEHGLAQTGELPGTLRVKRRARALFQRLKEPSGANARSISEPFDYISAFCDCGE